MQHALSGTERKQFYSLKEILVRILPKWGYDLDKLRTFGCSEGDRSMEDWDYHFVDAKGKEVVRYAYRRKNGNYEGTLDVKLPRKQSEALESKLSAFLSELSHTGTANRNL